MLSTFIGLSIIPLAHAWVAEQNAYCDSLCRRSPACADATHGTYCNYWAEVPTCYGLYSLDNETCYASDSDCLGYQPVLCDVSSIPTATNETLPPTTTLTQLLSPATALVLGLNVTCGLHFNGSTSTYCEGQLGPTNVTIDSNATTCDGIDNSTACLVSCVPILNSVINGTEYHCNCTANLSTHNATVPPSSDGQIPPTTTTTLPASTPTLPYGRYCGLLGDELPLMLDFTTVTVDIYGGDVFALTGIDFFGLDPNSPAGNTLDINLSDPQFTAIIGSEAAFNRQIFSLSYYSSTNTIGGFFTARPLYDCEESLLGTHSEPLLSTEGEEAACFGLYTCNTAYGGVCYHPAASLGSPLLCRDAPLEIDFTKAPSEREPLVEAFPIGEYCGGSTELPPDAEIINVRRSAIFDIIIPRYFSISGIRLYDIDEGYPYGNMVYDLSHHRIQSMFGEILRKNPGYVRFTYHPRLETITAHLGHLPLHVSRYLCL
ncbi:hypothetical protein FOZ60_017214 [Perkinsus olseni]|uniref:Uncharacterized protein n=1 Tax=Perkinsus olseni TaxID=32597 RepID=A0A7J6P4C0_PEROL|nr:hypothetical protein FOZ60_017214 [Perkinsus olseni]